MGELPKKSNVADVGASMADYFIVKQYESTDIGNNSHFAYFSDIDLQQLHGAILNRDFKGVGDFSAGGTTPNLSYITYINGLVGAKSGPGTAITWTKGASDAETEENFQNSIKAFATANSFPALQIFNFLMNGNALLSVTTDKAPQDATLSVSYLELVQGGAAKQFHGDNSNLIDILNNYYGIGKTEVVENKGVNFKTLKNAASSLQGVVMQTIGDIFGDQGLWPYYKKEAPWSIDLGGGNVKGGALSGTLFNYRAISGLSGQLTGLEYLVTGGENTSNYSGFVNLVDTPTGFSGGMLLKVTQDATGIEFVNPTGFLTSQDIVWKVYTDTTALPSATDYHGMFAHVHAGGGAAYMAHGGNWHKIWPNDIEAGSTSFTGLSGTPGFFTSDKYLKVTSDGTGIEYADINFPDNEVTFTGLSGTPGFFTADKYLKVTSDGTGVEYADIDFPDSEVTFTGLSGTPGFFTADKYLKVTSDGTGVEYADIDFPDSEVTFTGLSGTPGFFTSNKFLQVTADATGIEYVDISQVTGFLELDDTPTEYEENSILMSTSTGLAYTSLPGGTFTGLSDTPTGINNFDFLIGDDAGHVVATGDVSKLISFTGLKDTPSSWSPNQYLVINPQGNAVAYSGFNNTFTGLVDTPNPNLLNEGDFLVIDGSDKVTTRSSGQLSNLISFTGLNDTPNTITDAYYVVGTAGGNALGFTNVKPDEAGVAPTFINLPDTPNSFAGEQGNLLRINSTQNAVEFFQLTSSTINSLATLTGLSDTPTGITGNYLLVGSGSEFIYQPYINAFTGLNDTPSEYGSTGYALRISSDNKIEFYKPTFSGLFDTSEVLPDQYLSVDGTGGIYGRDIKLTGLSDVDSEGFGPNKFLQVTGIHPDYKFVYTGIHFTGLEGVPTDWSNTNTGKFLALNSAGNSIVFVNAPDGGGGGAASFLGLADVDPSSFSSESGKVLVVNSDENAITFTGLNQTFTGLLDTPTDYPNHLGITGIHYLTTTNTPNRTIWDNSLSVAINSQGLAITDLGFATGHLHERLYLTGLRDTPSNIENSKYLGTNGAGQIVWLDASAGGSAPSFSGLSDSPAGFHYSGVSGQFVVASGDGVVFYNPGINDLSGLAITPDLNEYLTFDGTFITGRTLSFSNLVETPTGISGGKFLKGTADGTGLEFVDIEFPESNNISGFTGLHDTPSYYTPEKFLRAHPDGTGIEYATPTFTGLVETPNSLQADAFLKVNSAGNGFVWSTGLSGSGYAQVITGATHFTGLQDTPNTITDNRVLFTKNGNINFIEPTGLSLKLTDLTDTPSAITDGKILVGNSAGKMELQDPASNYKVISVDEVSNDNYTSNSIILNSYTTGVHLKTFSAGNRIELNPVHSLSMDDIQFSVTNKSFQLEIEAAKQATTASAIQILDKIQYNSQKSKWFKGSTRYANLDKVLDGAPETSYKFGRESNDKFTSIVFRFKFPIYIHSFYYDGDGLPSDWYSKSPLGDAAGAQAGTITAFRTPRVETSQFSANGRTWKSLGKISSFNLFGTWWWPRIREIRISYSLTDINADKKYRLIDREFANPSSSINPKIYVHRGEEYDFLIKSKDEPFYIKTQPGVGTSNQYSHGVTNAGTTGQMPIVFDVPLDAPDRLYYQGANNPNLSGVIEIPPLDLTQQITDQITGEGVSTFAGLSDTPSTFDNDKYLKVTSDGTGIEYASIEFPDSEVTFTGLSGTPGSFTANKFLKVTSDGTGIEYADVPLDGSGASFFTGLIDAPSSLGSAGQIVRVNAGGTALEFADASAGGGGGGGSSSAAGGGLGSTDFWKSKTDGDFTWPDYIIVADNQSPSEVWNLGLSYYSENDSDLAVYHSYDVNMPIYYRFSQDGKYHSATSPFTNNPWGETDSAKLDGVGGGVNIRSFIDKGYVSYSQNNNDYFTGAMAGNEHWQSENKFYTDVPDAISLPFHNTIDTTGVFHLSQMSDLGLYYSLLEGSYYITFGNTPEGLVDGSQTAGFPVSKIPTSLSGCIADGHALYYGGGAPGADGADGAAGGGGGSAGGQVANYGGLGAHTGIQAMSNFYTNLPDKLIYTEADSETQQWTGILDFRFIKGYDQDLGKGTTFDGAEIYYEARDGNYRVTFRNDLEGTSHTFDKNVATVDANRSLSGFIDVGRAIYIGNLPNEGGVGSHTGISELSNFYQYFPDRIQVPVTRGTKSQERLFDFVGYFEDGAENDKVQYEWNIGGNERFSLRFDNDSNGTFHQYQESNDSASTSINYSKIASKISNQPTLGEFISGGRAIYLGGGSSAGGNGGGGGGSSSFSELSDTPANLENGKYLKVTSDGTGIEFVDIAGGGGGGFSLPGPTSATYAGGIELIKDTGNNIFKRIAQGNNISFASSTDGLTINADFPPATTTFRGLTDTPNSFIANKVLTVNNDGNALEYSDLNFKQPVGSGFAKHKPIIDQDSFSGDMPDHIYLQNSAGTNIQTFSFAQYSQGSYIEYSPTRETDFGSYVQFNDDAEGSYKSSNITQQIQNRMSISGLVFSGRHHHEAARNTGVHNQGFRSVLSAGGAELTEDRSIEPTLENVIGSSKNWTQLKFPFDGARECSWTVPPSLTQNFLDGTVQVEISWNSPSTAGNVAWDVKLESYGAGESIDTGKGTSFKRIVSSTSVTAYGINRERIEFVPTANELSPDGFLIITIKRDALAGSDTLNGFANVLYLSVIELI